MSLRKGGRKPLPPGKKRIKVAPALTPEAVAALYAITKQTAETQSDLIGRLLLRELKRLFPKG